MVKRKNILIFLSALFLLFSSFALACAPFLYNELEFLERVQLQAAFVAEAEANTLIAMRTAKEKVAVTDQERDRLPPKIESALTETVARVQAAKHYHRFQEVLPLFDPRYRRYHALKKESLENYQQATSRFLDSKRKEHQVAALLSQSIKLSQGMQNLSQDHLLEEITLYASISAQMQDQTNSLLNLGTVNSDLADFYLDRFQLTQDLAAILTNPELTESQKKTLIVNETASIPEKDYMALYTAWREQLIDPEVGAAMELLEIALNQMQEANDHYSKHNLKNDPISRVLSSVYTHYPKNQ